MGKCWQYTKQIKTDFIVQFMAKKPTLLFNIQKEDMKNDILHAHTKTFTLIRKHANTLNIKKSWNCILQQQSL